jgi:hypothetical protein
MPTKTIKGNDTLITDNPKDLTVGEVQNMITDSTHRFVTDSQISQWNSTSVLVKMYNTLTNAQSDHANLNVGDVFETLGSVSVNDKLGSRYRVSSTDVDGLGIAIGSKFASWFYSKDIGVGQTPQDVTASRVISTTYTNTTGKPIEVKVYLNITSASTIAHLKVNGVNEDSMGASTWMPSSKITLSAIVPVGGTYSIGIETGSTSIIRWTELR